MADGQKSIHVYYDGLCHMCTGTMKKIGDSSRGDTFSFRDVTKGDLPPGISNGAALHDMHVVDENGVVSVGGDAVLRILKEYPRWRWLARLGALPGVRQVVRVVYRIVATHRRRLNSVI